MTLGINALSRGAPHRFGLDRGVPESGAAPSLPAGVHKRQVVDLTAKLRVPWHRLIPRIAGFLGVCAGSTLSVAVTPVGPASFAATRWSTVLNAGAGETPEARAALERLCSTYWYPLYANIRRRGYSQEDACDLTQAFFASLLHRRSFASVGPEKGRFRSFLLTSLGYFLADQAKQRCAARRGGGTPLIELDALEAEHRYALEPVTEETPDKVFDRHWAAQLMDRAVARLETEQAQAGKAEQFARLQPFLAREPEPGEYEVLAAPLGVTPNAIASAVRRARLRLRELALAEAAETVASPAEAEAELRALLR